MSSASGTVDKLDIGGVFESTTDIFKKSFGTIWLVALIIMVPAVVINALLGDEGVLGLVAALVHLVASAWLVGTVVRIVEDVEADGRVDASIGDLLGLVWPRLIALILLNIVLGILITIGLVLLIVPGVILALMWIVAVPSLVVEDKGVFDSMSRSSELTKDNRMRILGLGILLIVLAIGVAVATSLLAAITPILGILVGLALIVVIYPWLSIVVAVLYFRLREVKGESLVADTALPGEAPAVDPPPPAV